MMRSYMYRIRLDLDAASTNYSVAFSAVSPRDAINKVRQKYYTLVEGLNNDAVRSMLQWYHDDDILGKSARWDNV